MVRFLGMPMPTAIMKALLLRGDVGSVSIYIHQEKRRGGLGSHIRNEALEAALKKQGVVGSLRAGRRAWRQKMTT